MRETLVAWFVWTLVFWSERKRWFNKHWRLGFLLSALLAFVGCVALVSCSPQTERVPGIVPPEPPKPMEFMPLPYYHRWWGNVERCTGLTGRMDKIRFFVAPRPFLAIQGSADLYLGLYFPDESKIILGISLEADSVTVHHEMLHALLDQNGLHDPNDMHPREEFNEKCGVLLGRRK